MRGKNYQIVFLIILILIFPIFSNGEESGLRAILVSPGIYGNTVTIEQSCPTFSWTSVNWASSYEVVVFKADSDTLLSYEEMSAYETPVLIKHIKGQAFSWTPSSIERLNNGLTYFWYVKAMDQDGNGSWSNGQSFRVELPLMLDQVEEQIREKLKEEGLSNESINNIFVGVGSDRAASNNSRQKNNAPLNGAGNIGRKGTDNLSRTSTIPGEVTGSEGVWNTYYGYGAAGGGVLTGFYNAFFGADSGYYTTSGYSNTFIGDLTGTDNTTGDYNTFIGASAGENNTTGIENTAIGDYAGYTITSGNGNVFLGNEAGYYAIGSDKLYIDNSNTGSPLIYGDFAANTVTVNGNLGMEVADTAVFQVLRTGGTSFKLAAGAANTQIGTQSNHGIKFITNNTWKMKLNADGTISMADGGSYNGTWNDASSVEFKENIRELTSDQAINALDELSPVLYNYKKYRDEERVGFIAEHVPEIVANNKRKNLSAMDIVAVLTKVVKEQQEVITDLKSSKVRQNKIISELLKRMEKLENK